MPAGSTSGQTSAPASTFFIPEYWLISRPHALTRGADLLQCQGDIQSVLRCEMFINAQPHSQMPGQLIVDLARDLRLWRVFAPQPVLILLLLVAFGLAGVLPCIVHCGRDHTQATAESAPAPITWFLCDFPSAFGEATTPPASHHHHLAPQLPFEPTLAFVGMLAAALLVTSRLLLQLRRRAEPLRFAPPTPPPRLTS